MELLTKIKQQIKPFVPQWAIDLKRAIDRRILLRKINQVQARYPKIVDRLRKKEKIKVAFFLIHSSVWKYDKLFQLMLADDKFEPIIVICPYIIYGEEIMIKDLKQAEEFVKSKKYPYVMTLNFETGKWLDVKQEIKPDIVFFTNPHQLTRKEYYIFNYTDCLTCYVPYNFGNCHLLETFHNQEFHNLLWKLFAETDIHKQFSIDVALNRGVNVITTGFPGTDIFLDKDYIPKNPWKEDKKQLKKIIWAPHHTIDNDKSLLNFSSFLMYTDYMLELADKYKDFVQFAFKPHPLLKPKLYLHSDWGETRTDNYYSLWNSIENTQLEIDEYEDLFLTSDAMIHDSGSFLIEYLYLNKPVLRTDRDDSITDRLNKFGSMAYNMHYHARTKDNIETFVKNVIEGKDEMKEVREQFKQDYLLPPNNHFASNNIFDEIKKCLNGHRYS